MWQNDYGRGKAAACKTIEEVHTHSHTQQAHTHTHREWHTWWESFALRKAKRKCDDATAAEAVKTAAKVQNKWYKLQKLKWQPNNTTTTTATATRTTATAQVATATTSRRSSSSIKSQRELGPGSSMNNNLEYCTRYICRYISCTLWQRGERCGGGLLVVAATWPGS